MAIVFRDFKDVWDSVVRFQGETFYTINHRPFTYTVEGDKIIFSRAKQFINGKNNLYRAYVMLPVPGPSMFSAHGVVGASYIYGLLYDTRICTAMISDKVFYSE